MIASGKCAGDVVWRNIALALLTKERTRLENTREGDRTGKNGQEPLER